MLARVLSCLTNHFIGHRPMRKAKIVACVDHLQGLGDAVDLMDGLANHWSAERADKMERSTAISALSPAEITLLNKIFGSDAMCVGVIDTTVQKEILGLMPHDLYRNFRRATYKRNQPVLVEDWLWCTSGKKFIKSLEKEMAVLELVLAGFLIYLLNGFKIPRDMHMRCAENHIKVDASALLGRKADIFLLGNLTPGVTSRFLYWKLTSVLMGMMRMYAKKDTMKAARRVKKIMNEVNNGAEAAVRQIRDDSGLSEGDIRC